MIHQLEQHQFQAATPIFAGHKQYVPVLAVLAGRFPGRVYADHPDTPTTALVWALDRWAYIEGDPENTAFNSHLLDLIRYSIFPAYLQMRLDWFELYAPGSREWATAIGDSLSDLNLELHHESVSVLDPAAYSRLRKAPAAPHGWKLQRCDIPIVSEHARSSGLIPAEMKRRTAFGYRLIDGDRIIAVCKSIGFEANDEFMVEVETHSKADRGKGYATLVTTALIDHALERGLSPLWETTEFNVPSQRLAGRLGFMQRESYPVYAMQIPHEENVK